MPHQDLIIDGVAYPSATELTSLLPQPWILAWYKASVKKHGWRGWCKNLATSNRGMKIGSLVHGMIEAYITKAPAVPYDGKYGADQYADALYDKVNPLVQEWVAVEPHVINHELKISGTADAIIKLNDSIYPGGDSFAILDWKTSAQKSETHPIQLAIYAMCYNSMHVLHKDGYMHSVNRGMIARVDKKSKKLTVHLDVYENLEQYYPVVRALREIYTYTKG